MARRHPPTIGVGCSTVRLLVRSEGVIDAPRARGPASCGGADRLRLVASENDELSAFADWSTSYRSGALTLPAFFVAPPGDGPFPAVVFHHGSGGLLGAARSGAEALLGMGYAVLLAVRRGHNGAPGIFWETRVTAPWGSPEMGPQLVDALEDECDDAVAALAWVKEQPMVDAARVAMIGSSYGGVMVMLAARRRASFRAGVSFAGPSITWPDAPAYRMFSSMPSDIERFLSRWTS